MRRWILVLFVCLLPMQWSLASAASVCGHGSDCAPHLGHHEHAHASVGDGEGAAPSDGWSGDVHPDCQTCHAVGVAVARGAEAAVPVTTPDAPVGWTVRAWADPPIGALLRPPAPRLV